MATLLQYYLQQTNPLWIIDPNATNHIFGSSILNFIFHLYFSSHVGADTLQQDPFHCIVHKMADKA